MIIMLQRRVGQKLNYPANEIFFKGNFMQVSEIKVNDFYVKYAFLGHIQSVITQRTAATCRDFCQGSTDWTLRYKLRYFSS